MGYNSFINKILLSNASLSFIDAETGDTAKASDMVLQPEGLLTGSNGEKRLVFLYIDNSLVSLKLLFTFLNTDHALVLLNPALHPSMKAELESTYRPHYIYDTISTERENYLLSFPGVGNGVYVRQGQEPATAVHPDIKLLLSTSGTTGSPKFVKLSEQNLLSNALSITEYLPIISTDIVPLNLSVFYSYGLSILNSNCMKGGTIVCTNKDVIQRDFWNDFEKFGYTSMAGVPYVYEMLNRLGFLKKAYPSLRYMTQAGGKLANHLVELFGGYCREHNVLFYVMYGQTEATARMSFLSPEYTLEKLGSIGKAIPSGSFEVIAETGELVYKGPNIFGGYASSPSDLQDFKKEEQLFTGDLARIDEDGFVYITGRAKRFIKLFGTRTNLDEVELHLKARFQKVNFGCTGVDDKLVIASDIGKEKEPEIKAFLKETLKIHHSVIKLISIDEMPLTANGKINYSAIMQML